MSMGHGFADQGAHGGVLQQPVTTLAEPAADNYARFTGTRQQVEARTPAEVLADIGGAAAIHAANHMPGGSDLLNVLKFFNGTFLESFDAIATSNGTTVTMSLEKSGTGDLTMVFSDGETLLDCTPALTIGLTEGSDTAPKENFIYIPQSTKVLTWSNSAWPTAEHIKVAYFVLQSASFVQTEGPLVTQNWNDHAADTGTSLGHLSHIVERIRAETAIYHSGVAPTVTIIPNAGVPDNVDLALSAGIIYQLHRHVFAALDTAGADNVHVVNDSVTPYDPITDLNVLLLDSTGASMAGKYFNLVVWAVANKSGEHAPMMVNLPSGSYNTVSGARNDTDGHTNFSMPAAFSIDSSTGFLVARLLFRHQNASGGTWTLVETGDLRGLTPVSAIGGGTALSQTEFADNQFLLFDESDSTKQTAFQLSGVTTGNTRTITMADQDVNLTPGTGSFATEAEGNLAATSLQKDGSVALTGPWAAGAFNITGLAKLGIGETTPLSELSVKRGSPANSSNAESLLSSTGRTTGTDVLRGGHFIAERLATSDTSNILIGLNAQATDYGSVNLTNTKWSLVGVRARAAKEAGGAGTIASMRAFSGEIELVGGVIGVTVTNACTYLAEPVDIISASTVEHACNFYGKTHTAGGGTINHAWGVRLQKQTAGGTSNHAVVLEDDGIGAGIALGGAQDASIYYDGTDLILDPDLVGAGKVLIGATGDDDLQANRLIATELYSADGLSIDARGLKLNPDVQGDVVLFGDTDVDDAADGRSIYIQRKAAEGDVYLRFFVTAAKTGKMEISDNFFMESTGYMKFQAGNHMYLDLEDAAGSHKLHVRDSAKVDRALIDSDGNAWFDGNITLGGTVDGRDVAADGAVLDTAMQDLIDDLTPQLGGNLDGNDKTFFGSAASGGNSTWGSTSHGTKGKLLFGLTGDFVFDEVNGRLGIGEGTPTTILHVKGGNIDHHRDGDINQYRNYAHSDPVTHRALLGLRRSRGTEASETTVVNGDQIGSFGFFGYDGTSYQQRAEVVGEVDGPVVDITNSVPMSIAFKTGNTSRSNRLLIDSSGDVTLPPAGVRLTFGDTGNEYIEHSAGKLEYNTASGVGHQFRVNSSRVVELDTQEIRFMVGGSEKGSIRWASNEVHLYDLTTQIMNLTLTGVEILETLMIGAFSPPAASAILELSSTTGALLVSRMTTTQRNAMTAVNGMIMYNESTGELNYRKAGAWVAI